LLEMKTCSFAALVTIMGWASTAPVFAQNVTEAELIQAATSLARQYDENYAAKDPAAMAALYAADGVLVSPRGPVIRGRAELKAYYTKRFASGANGHAIKVMEVHVQGEGGYGLSQFSVKSPGANGEPHEVHGSILAVYHRDPDGWHLRMVQPSVPEPAAN
jgi:uncharacterized protein (TIGR02246 family)